MVRSRAPHHTAGFTLLEAMIAAGVLAVGIVGVVGLQGRLFNSAGYSHDMSAASYILQYRAEEVGALGFERLTTSGQCNGGAPGCMSGGAFTGPPASGCSEQVDDPQPLEAPDPVQPGKYRVDTGLIPHGGVNHPNALVATISVCWVDRGGVVRQIQATRVVGDRG